MCEFHDCNCNGLGDIWWTDKCMYFSSIDCNSCSRQAVLTVHVLYCKINLSVTALVEGSVVR